MEQQSMSEVRVATHLLRSVEGAAALLGISKWTVRSYIKAGKLQAIRLGRRVLIEDAELERFVAEARALALAQANQAQQERV